MSNTLTAVSRTRPGLLLIVLLALLLPSFLAHADDAAEVDPAAEAKAQEKEQAEALAKLLKTKVSIHVRDVPFRVALVKLTEQLDQTVVKINPQVLREARIDQDAKVSLQLTDAPFHSAFDLIFNQAQPNQVQGGWQGPVPPIWQIDSALQQDGERVSLLLYTFEQPETRVYDIRNLLVVRQDDLTQPAWDEKKKAAVRQDYIKQITDLIKQTVGQPAHWSDKHQDTDFGGTITELNGNLIIKTTPTNHKQVLGLLGRLGAFPKYEIAFDAHVILLDPLAMKEVFGKGVPGMQWSAKGLALPPAEGGKDEQQPTVLADLVSASAFLDDDQAKQLLKAAEQADGPSFVTALPRMTIKNGQKAYTLRVTQTAYVSGVAQAEQGKPAEPQIEVIRALPLTS